MPDRTRRTRPAVRSAGYTLIAIGLLLVGIGIAALDGFFGGLLAGAGVALAAAGGALVATGGHARSRNELDAAGSWWLPSRDGDR